MFFSSRIVVIDDNPLHLQGIRDALHSLTLDCHTIEYDEQTGVGVRRFPGMRVLFLDLHLNTGGGVGTAGNADYAILAGILDQIVDDKSGPFVLILWTQHPNLLTAFSTYLNGLSETALPSGKRPVAAYALNKGDFINVTSGHKIAGSDLKKAISDKMAENPQMKALFSWEADVTAAMDATLRSVIDLVPFQDRTTVNFGEALGKVLFRISQAGSGDSRAMENPRDSVNRVLVPVLADRIAQHDPQGASTQAWKTALVQDTGKLSLQAKAELNSAIHISSAATPNSSPIKHTDLGAVISLPFTDVEKELKVRFGLDIAKLRSKDFFELTDDAEWANCNLVLVQIGATCDHAQPKDGPLLYLLGVEWPILTEKGPKKLSEARKAANGREWITPVIQVGPGKVPGRLSVFLNCSISFKRSERRKWAIKYRLREELISHLTQEYARYISRPGVVSLN